MDGMMGASMLVWVVVAVVGLAMTAVGAAWLVRASVNRPARSPEVVEHSVADRSSALELAKERYVQGEIDHAELERILDGLLRAEQRPAVDT